MTSWGQKMQGQRPASMMSLSPTTQVELQNASEAMQKAAEAMIAATESFRNQFHAQEFDDDPPRPYTYHAKETRDGDNAGNLLPRNGSLSGESRDRRVRSGTLAATRPIMLAGMLSKRAVLQGAQMQSPTPGADSQAGSTARPSSRSRVENSWPTTDWLVNGSSTSTLEPAARAPAVRTGPGPQWPGGPYRSAAPAHVDLVEAAERIKAQQQLATQQQEDVRSIFQGQTTDVGEPSPVVRIGRHTYVRSIDDFGTTLFYGDEPRQPSTVESINRTRSHARRQQSRPRTPATQRSELPLIQEILFVLVVCLAQVLMLAGISQALVPASIIGESFQDTTAGALSWYSAAYSLTSGTFVLPAGRLGDLFGHKKLFIVGFLWFALWSCVVGFAGMVERAGAAGTVFFCFSRAMQGIGPALLVPNGQAMLGRAYRAGPRKNMVMSLFGAAAPLGFVLGAVMAGLFAAKASWPWAFWSMGGVCLALAAVSFLVVPPFPPIKRVGRPSSLWTRLDGCGIFFGVCGLVLLSFAFNQAPLVSWRTPYTYFILVIAVILLAAFVYNELVAPHPLVPISAMRAQTNFVLGCTAAGWGCFGIWVYYAFDTLQGLRGWSPLLSSAAFAHAPVSGFVASMLTGYLMGKIKPHWIMFISMCAFFVGSLLLATGPVDQNYWYSTFFSILVMPFGMDMSNPAAIILLSNSVSMEHQGIAASLVVTVVNYSIALALGIGGTIEVSTNHDGRDVLAGVRGAQFFGLGLGALGVVLAAGFLVRSYVGTPLTRKT